MADISLADCQARLTASPKPPGRFALAWAVQTRATVQMLDATTYRFHLKRLEDPSHVNWGSLAELHGQLEAITPTSTKVTGQSQFNWVYLLVTQGLWFLLSIFVMLSSVPNVSSFLWIGGIVIANLLGFTFLWLYAQSQAKELEKTLRQKINSATLAND